MSEPEAHVVTVSSCPTEIVQASIETVWGLLTDPARWSSFYDLRLTRIDPPGRATAGQQILGESGPRWLHLGVAVTFLAIDEARQRMELEVQMPLGIVVREELSCAPINARLCRVSYHCHFALPPGWRGILVRMVLWRELRVGPTSSLRRLKQAAEHQFKRLDSSDSATAGEP